MDRVGVGGLCGAAVRARAATGRARLMRGFFDLRQRAHAPAQELHNGGFVAYAETPARADAILAALGPLETPADRGEAAILAVHDMATEIGRASVRERGCQSLLISGVAG